MKIALIGLGTMGTLVAALANEKGHSVNVRIGDGDRESSAEELSSKLSGSDAVIDFSAADAVLRNTRASVAAGVPLIEGTTGWKSDFDLIRSTVNDGGGAFIHGANFSVGVNLFYRLARHAAQLFAKFPEYQVFIEEQHHSLKKDAPSGTALILKEIVASHISGEFGVASTRAGSIPGTHRVGFDGTADQILLEHTARSRDGFARGAIAAAEWIVGKHGFYEFGEVIDELIKNR